MKLKLLILKLFFLALIPSETNDLYSYSWSPNENISATDIYNPIVSPQSTTSYTVLVEPSPTTNLIYNGDFSLGNTGFDSDYFYTSGASEFQGFYGVFTNPTQFNSWFGDCEDHSDSADGQMLVADGSTSLGQYVWCQQIGVEANKTYTFSTWITNIYWQAPPLIRFSINGNDLGSSLQLSNSDCAWEEFSANWFSGNNTSANICIESINTAIDGNDFAVDDLSFSLASESFIDTFLIVVLEHSTSIQIDTSICANESIFIGGFEIPAGQQDTVAYTALNGCDSLVYVNVNSIDSSFFETRIDTFCLGDTTYYMGIPITQDTSICSVYTNYLGCDSSICLVINFLSEATIDVINTAPSCFGGSNGMLAVEPTAGLAPYQYLWNTGGNSSSIENLFSGFYSVTIIDANGCVVEKQVELEEPLLLSADYTVIAPSCFGQSDGQISFSISGGVPDYSIIFEDQPTASTIENIGSGNYTIFIEDNNGCLLTFDVPVSEPAPIDIALSSKENILLGSPFEIQAQVTAVNDYQIQWFPAAHLSCATCLNPTTTTLDDISYQLSVEDANGCSADETIAIRVQNNFDLYIPNAFSPNGDGFNDFFELYPGKGVKRIKSFHSDLIFREGTLMQGGMDLSMENIIIQGFIVILRR